MSIIRVIINIIVIMTVYHIGMIYIAIVEQVQVATTGKHPMPTTIVMQQICCVTVAVPETTTTS